MPKINFDTIILKEDWARALQSILDDVQVAIEQNDGARKIELQLQLKTFIKRSPTMVDALDDIAIRAIDDLTNSVLDDAIRSIKDRNDELRAATAEIEAATTEAEKDAKTLQLKKVIDILDRAKAAVETLKGLEEALTNPDADLLAKIKSASNAVEELVKLAKAQTEES